MAKRKIETVKCYNCRYAVLQQWDRNPIVAYCNKYGTRDTAMTVRKCDKYANNPDKPEVSHLIRFK